METFTLTKDHIKLIRQMFVGWQDGYEGAPEVNIKRPYGNSDVFRDVAEILEVKWEGMEDEEYAPETIRNQLTTLHRETEFALQIVLVTGSFEPGKFVKKDRYMRRSWERVGE
jgi:hypothetical protein